MELSLKYFLFILFYNVILYGDNVICMVPLELVNKFVVVGGWVGGGGGV